MRRIFSPNRCFSSLKTPEFVYELNNGVHFDKKSAEPVWPKDERIKLYSMRFCPYAHRVHLVLNIKKIPYNVAYVELKEKPEWLVEKSPKAKVPAIELPNGERLVESLIICDYLEEAFPQVPLWPSDPLLKAKDRLVIDKFISGSRRMVLLVLAKSQNQDEDVKKAVKMVAEMNRELGLRGGNFFFGNRPGMVDLMIWPWMIKLTMVEKLFGDGFKFENYAHLDKWRRLMMEQDAVKGFYISPEHMETFFGAMMQGVSRPPYNLIALKASL